MQHRRATMAHMFLAQSDRELTVGDDARPSSVSSVQA
jgi:hypothetical protein